MARKEIKVRNTADIEEFLKELGFVDSVNGREWIISNDEFQFTINKLHKRIDLKVRGIDPQPLLLLLFRINKALEVVVNENPIGDTLRRTYGFML